MADRDPRAPAEGVPARRIDRDALERIIQRAAELQAGELETGDSLTEQELLKLGADVGIDGRFLRQAMFEESAGAHAAEKGFLARWFGPGVVGAGRVVPGDRAQVEAALEQWMVEGEALAVKRRLSDRTVWEKQRGFFADMKRGFGVGGKSYMLAKARDVTVAVTQLEAGFCHVEISADIAEKRGGTAAGVAASAGTFGLAGAAMLVLIAQPFSVFAIVPLALAVVTPVSVSRNFRRFAEAIQLAILQVLDRLERGEVRPRHRGPDFGGMLFGQVAGEVRRAISEASQRPRRQLPRREPNP